MDYDKLAKQIWKDWRDSKLWYKTFPFEYKKGKYKDAINMFFSLPDEGKENDEYIHELRDCLIKCNTKLGKVLR